MESVNKSKNRAPMEVAFPANSSHDLLRDLVLVELTNEGELQKDSARLVRANESLPFPIMAVMDNGGLLHELVIDTLMIERWRLKTAIPFVAL